MHDFFAFAQAHWILIALIAVAFIWVMVEEALHQSGGGSGLSSQLVVQKINREDAVVVDVRDPSAFSDGHISGALNITKAQLERDPNLLKKHNPKPLILVCALGRSVVPVLELLRKNGYINVYLLKGGLAEWKNAGLPLVKGSK